MVESGQLMEVMRRSEEYLRRHGIDNARRESEWLFCAVLQLQRLDLYTRYDMLLDAAEMDALRQAVMRRGRREPLAYIIGDQPFADFTVQVTPAVLVPRPESEDLVDLVVGTVAGRSLRMIDVGTGSGVLAIALARRCPESQITAVDMSAEALAVAQANGQRWGVKVCWGQSDLLTDAAGPWDVIVANLPYIGTAEMERCDPELSYEPALALWSGDDGLSAITALIAQLPEHLAADGICWLEHGDRQAEAVAKLAAAHDFQTETYPDRFAQQRFTRIYRRVQDV
ncbi:MAG: peptide chain release factor N(5)-glutamine methyltransferase [Planctomycetota bacterium]|nr:MAG: peptide chain release factor N(5)-glutamine methyltransferase [Planctomycetota bacterium]